MPTDEAEIHLVPPKTKSIFEGTGRSIHAQWPEDTKRLSPELRHLIIRVCVSQQQATADYRSLLRTQRLGRDPRNSPPRPNLRRANQSQTMRRDTKRPRVWLIEAKAVSLPPLGPPKGSPESGKRNRKATKEREKAGRLTTPSYMV